MIVFRLLSHRLAASIAYNHSRSNMSLLCNYCCSLTLLIKHAHFVKQMNQISHEKLLACRFILLTLRVALVEQLVLFDLADILLFAVFNVDDSIEVKHSKER